MNTVKSRLCLIVLNLTCLTLSSLFLPLTTGATLCFNFSSVESSFDEFSVVFSGRVVSVEDNTSLVEPIEVYKGDVDNPQKVTSYLLSKDTEVLIFGDRTDGDIYLGSGMDCSLHLLHKEEHRNVDLGVTYESARDMVSTLSKENTISRFLRKARSVENRNKNLLLLMSVVISAALTGVIIVRMSGNRSKKPN